MDKQEQQAKNNLNNQRREFNNNNINRRNNGPKQIEQQQQRPRKKVNRPDPMGNPAAMGKFGMKIIRDIAFGKCNIQDISGHFRNPIFGQALIREIADRLQDEYVYIYALNNLCMNPNTINPRAQRLLRKHNQTYEAWTFVQQVVGQIMSTGDPSPLLVLANRLPQYKYCM